MKFVLQKVMQKKYSRKYRNTSNLRTYQTQNTAELVDEWQIRSVQFCPQCNGKWDTRSILTPADEIQNNNF